MINKALMEYMDNRADITQDIFIALSTNIPRYINILPLTQNIYNIF